MNFFTQQSTRAKAALCFTAAIALALVSFAPAQAQDKQIVGLKGLSGLSGISRISRSARNLITAEPRKAVERSNRADWANAVIASRSEHSAATLDVGYRETEAMQLQETGLLGARRHQLDAVTRVDGWKVNNNLYFGKCKGEYKGMALIWQRRANQQIAFSEDGLRLTRRFR